MTDPDSNHDSWQEQPIEDDVQTASQMLVQAREAKGLSQKEVADHLFLSTTFIRYIDDGEFQKLPKPAFIRGYLRSYARVVELDGAAVVAAYERDQNIAPVMPQIGRVTEEPIGSGAFTGPVVLTGIVGLVLICVVVALVWWLASGIDKKPPGVAASNSPALSQTPAARVPKRVSPSASTKTGEGTTAQAAASESSTSQTTTGTANPGAAVPAQTGTPAGTTAAKSTDNSATAPAGPGGEPAEVSDTTPKAKDVKIERRSDGNKQVITVHAGAGNDTMAFSFSGNCWVEITDGRGEEIYGDLNHAGDVMTVYGTGPFKVLLGKAPVVTMTWQGNQVDLARYTNKDQTAVVRTARLGSG